MRENEPWVYRCAFKFFEKATDYMAYLLTGNAVCAALTPQEEILETVEQMSVDPGKLPEVKRADLVVGEVTGSAEEMTGLCRGTPVVSGGADGICSIYGTGVKNPGEAATVVGTSTCIDACLGERIVDPHKRVWTTYNLMIEKWVMAGCANSSGASYKWFRDKFCQYEVRQAEETGVRLYEILDREAENVKPGCNGLVFLPYLNGERSPIWDPDARGVFLGMTSNHGKPHFLRAILEGTAFSFYDIMLAMEGAGARIDEIRICGGGAKSPLWRQIKADVSGKPILLPEVTDASILGAAVLAARAVGAYGNIEEAMSNMVRIVGRNEPDEARHQQYCRIYEIYREAYQSLRGTFKKMASLPQELR
jgi:xylulokinase